MSDLSPRHRADHVMDLAGPWRVALDLDNQGVVQQWFTNALPGDSEIVLPGTLAENGFGFPFDPQVGRYQTIQMPFVAWPAAGYSHKTRVDDLGHLVQDRLYVGAAWYERSFEAPPSWADRKVRLTMERVKWASRVWLDGREVGGADSLVTPHIIELGALKPGSHRLTIRVDNGLVHNIGRVGHNYGVETEPLWNGMTGELQIEALPTVRVEHTAFHTTLARDEVLVHLTLVNDQSERITGEIEITIASDQGDNILGAVKEPIVLDAEQTKSQTVQVRLASPADKWDEFHPTLYRAQVKLTAGGEVSSHRQHFGFRNLQRDGRRLVLNERDLFLRGTLDCAIHPLTEAPPTDVESWRKVFGVMKATGFNHVRFHSYCPPDAAFEAADELGLYLQVETTFWVDNWIHHVEPQPPLLGTDETITRYVMAESRRIIEAYGNHPSFMFFSFGNEFGMSSPWDQIEQMLAETKKLDNRILYNATTARRRVASDDFWVTHSTGKAGTRGTGPAHTNWSFKRAVDSVDLPVVAHETGQRPSWPVYQTELASYTGVAKPWNLVRLRDKAKPTGLLEKNETLAEATARFAMLQYKAEHEAMRRTPGFGGYQLLMLHDFTGQGEALVGLLDSLYRPKPGVRFEDILQWNAPTTPLAKFASYTWRSDQTFSAQIDLAHNGPDDLAGAKVNWRLESDEFGVIAAGRLPAVNATAGSLITIGSVKAPLARISNPAMLTLSVAVASFENQWRLWVYPRTPAVAPRNVLITQRLDEQTAEALSNGKKVLLLAHQLSNEHTRRTSWDSTYWSGAWSTADRTGLGVLCKPDHPALAGFPNQGHSDWQWRGLTSGAVSVKLSPALAEQAAVVEQISDFHFPRREAHVMEMQVGAGRLLVCGYDLINSLDRRPAAAAFRNSLLQYMHSDAFAPKAQMSIEQATTLLKPYESPSTRGVTISASSAASQHPPEHAIDGDPNTFWHTPWGPIEPNHPHELTLQLKETAVLTGLRLKGRSDSANGRFNEIEIHLSKDGREWGDPIVRTKLKNNAEWQTVAWRGQEARYIRVKVLSGVNGLPFASLGEVDHIEAPGQLGKIE